MLSAKGLGQYDKKYFLIFINTQPCADYLLGYYHLQVNVSLDLFIVQSYYQNIKTLFPTLCIRAYNLFLAGHKVFLTNLC